MTVWRRCNLWTFRFLICGALSLGLYGAASAGMVSTQEAIEAGHVAQTRTQMKALLQRPELTDELKALGASGADAQARVDAMTDDEVLALAGKVGNLPAGGRLSHNELLLILIIVLILVL